MTNPHEPYILLSIEREKDRLRTLLIDPNETFDNQFNALNNIISLKILINYVGTDSLYLDFKKYFPLYVKSIEEKDSEYDVISVDTIANKLSVIAPKERIELLKYFKWTLMTHGYNESLIDCDTYISKAYMRYYSENPTFINLIKLISLWSTLSIVNLIVVLISFYAATSLILIDAPYPSWQMFDTDFQNYSENSLINHLINVLTLLFDLKDGMKMHPIGAFSVLLSILGKMVYILILVNYFAKKLIENLKL